VNNMPSKCPNILLIMTDNQPADLIHDPAHAILAESLRQRIDDFFDRYSDPRFDLWRGGAAKSNSDKPWLWRDAWGEAWAEVF